MEQGSSSSDPGRRLYVLLDTSTGKTTQIPMPEGADIDTDPEDALQVSADFKGAIPTNTLSDEVQRSATLTLYPLAEAQEPLVHDLRAITKQTGFSPIAAAFDPSDASRVRVVDEEGFIWDLKPSTKTATKEKTKVLGTVDSSTSISFDPRSGTPYIDSPTAAARFKGWPQPGGEVLTEEKGYPALPDGDGVVFKRSSGEEWAFQVEGTAFRMYNAPARATSWKQVKVQPTPPIPSGDGVQVDSARPATE